MKDIQYERIIERLKSGYKNTAVVAVDYPRLTHSIHSTMKAIQNTQKLFDRRHTIEKLGIPERKYLIFSEKMYNLTKNQVFGSWSDLFDTQLHNVDYLTTDLHTLIKGSEGYLQQLNARLLQSINTAEQHHIQKIQNQKYLPEVQIILEKQKTSLEESTPDVPTHYEALRQYITQEHAMIHALSETALVSSVHKKDLEKIEFLRRHAAFHMATIFSAKKLAVSAKQICDTLGELKGVYEIVKPTRTCLEAIHQGLGALRGYTEDLNNVYQQTFRTTQEINHGKASNLELLTRSSDQLNPLISEMLSDLEKELSSN